MTTDNIEKIFLEICNLISNNYVLFGEKKISWHDVKQKYHKYIKNIQCRAELYKLIEDMLIKFKDPHTKIYYRKDPYNEITLFPVLIVPIDNDYYIHKCLDATSKLSAGMKIISIDNIIIEQIKDNLYKKFGYKSKSANKNAFINQILNNNQKETLTITARNGAQLVTETLLKQKFNYDIASCSKIILPFSTCMYEYLCLGILYIRILTFNKTVVQDFLDILRKNENMESLIIDIRGNNGGAVSNAATIASFFLKNSKIIGEKMKRKNNSSNYIEFDDPIKIMINPNQDVKVNFKDLIILCDEFTMSSSEFIFLETLKSDPRIQVIGTRTGGLIHGATIYTLFDGTKISLTTWKYSYLNKQLMKEEGITPDIEIKNGINFIIKNEDTQLSYAKKLLGI